MIKTEALTKKYGEVTAVDRVTLDLPSGSVVGLMGPTGAGKTSLLKLLLGLVRPSSGTGKVLGCDLTDSVAIRRRAALVPEAKALYPGVSVRSFLQFSSSFFPDANITKALDVLQRWRVDADQPGDALSRGSRTKVLLAAALAREAELFLLDEPSEGLDSETIEDLWGMFMRRVGTADGAGLVISSHRLDEIERVCDRVVVLNHGRLVLEGDLDELKGQWRRILLRRRDKEWSAESIPGVVATRSRDGVIEATTSAWDATLPERLSLDAEVLDVHQLDIREIYLTVVGHED